MRKNYTLLKAEPNATTGVSVVTIGTDLGVFEGTAECMINELDKFSNYFGCRLAEMRANIKYAKGKIKFYRAQYQALNNYFKTMKNTRNWDPDAYYVQKLTEHMKVISQEIQHWQGVKTIYEEAIKNAIASREEHYGH